MHQLSEPIGTAAGPDVHRAFAALWDHLVVHDRPVRSDAIVCFGSGHAAVPEVAADLYHRRLAPVVLTTGAVLAGGRRSPSPGGSCEADAFAERLIALGVPERAVLRERRSTNTGENVAFALADLESRGVVPRSILAVAWPLVARRIGATAARQRPDLRVATVPAVPRDTRWPPTEAAVTAALGEWDRLERYVDEGHVVAQAASPAVRRAVPVLRQVCR